MCWIKKQPNMTQM